MANSNQTVAINGEKIDSCILEMTGYIEKLKTVFLRLDDAMNSTSNFYQCENATAIRNKYSIFRDNYNIVIANLTGYIDELNAIKQNYSLLSQELSVQIEKNAINLESGYDYYQG